MAAIVIRENAKATWVPGMASVRAKACDMVRRAVDYAAAAVMICAVGTADGRGGHTGQAEPDAGSAR